MGDMLHPGYQDILTQNYHIFSRYLYAEDFIAELISKEVLSTNDKEFITNPYVNQTRRQKTSKYQQNDLCAQQRLRSTWASKQSDQSLLHALYG